MKIRTADLSDAQLDYWTARAQGIPAEQLEIRQVPRTDMLICVRKWQTNDPIIGPDVVRLAFSTLWAQCGPLVEMHQICLDAGDGSYTGEKTWEAHFARNAPVLAAEEITGPTPQVAICRAIVRAAFGDEVEEVAVCE